MSITVNISGNNSELESYFHPPLNLTGKYECGLLYCSILKSLSKGHYINNNTRPVIRIECDLIYGSYTNGLPTHVIHEFVYNTASERHYIETPQSVIYFPLNKNIISSICIKIVDQFGYIIDFIEHIQLRLHLRKS